MYQPFARLAGNKCSMLVCMLVAGSFANGTAGSTMVARNGRWLGDPVVVMYASNASALLQLASPVYDAAAGMLTFQARAQS